jgi:uncharacterized membrane protein YoaK (UPF0700 family)
MLGAAVAAGDIGETLHLFAAISAFVSGCAISGAIIKDSTLRIRGSYALALCLVSLLLLSSISFFRAGSMVAIYLTSMACGIQNAMVTTYSGAALRTTHISGMFTDLGIALGHFLRGVPNDPKRLRLCLIVIAGFLSGGVFGSYLYARVGYGVLVVPAGLTLLLAAVTVSLARKEQ